MHRQTNCRPRRICALDWAVPSTQTAALPFHHGIERRGEECRSPRAFSAAQEDCPWAPTLAAQMLAAPPARFVELAAGAPMFAEWCQRQGVMDYAVWCDYEVHATVIARQFPRYRAYVGPARNLAALPLAADILALTGALVERHSLNSIVEPASRLSCGGHLLGVGFEGTQEFMAALTHRLPGEFECVDWRLEPPKSFMLRRQEGDSIKSDEVAAAWMEQQRRNAA